MSKLGLGLPLMSFPNKIKSVVLTKTARGGNHVSHGRGSLETVMYTSMSKASTIGSNRRRNRHVDLFSPCVGI